MRERATGIGIAACSILLLLTSCAPPAPIPTSIDERQRLRLPPQARDKVLLEMRLMLEATDQIMQGLVREDHASVGRAARGAGMAMAADIDPEIMKHLPQEFLDLGVRTHKAFDELADRMAAGGTTADAIRGLAGLTGNCVGCHASYRLDELR